jgi:hypothetical protein
MRDTREAVWRWGGEGGHVGGTLYSDGIAETHRTVQEHFFRKFRSYGLSDWVIAALRAKGCVYVDIIETGASGVHRTLRTELGDWLQSGLKYVNVLDGRPDPQTHVRVEAMMDTRTQKRWRPGRIQETLA